MAALAALILVGCSSPPPETRVVYVRGAGHLERQVDRLTRIVENLSREFGVPVPPPPMIPPPTSPAPGATLPVPTVSRSVGASPLPSPSVSVPPLPSPTVEVCIPIVEVCLSPSPSLTP